MNRPLYPSASGPAAITGPEDVLPVVAELKEARNAWRTRHHRLLEQPGREFPSLPNIRIIVQSLKGILFPLRLGPPNLTHDIEDEYVLSMLTSSLGQLEQEIMLALVSGQKVDSHAAGLKKAREIVQVFSSRLPHVRTLLDRDVEAAFAGDPAATNIDEILLCYPGIQAVISYRLAHELYRLGVPLIPRIITELAHSQTGIDIHPGAQINEGFFIDHGTGVVVGETCIIGRNVRLYQAVTLGAKRFETDGQGQLLKGYPRHPVVEDNVTIYAGTTVLGRITIGKGSIIGGNVWLTQSIEPYSQITQATSSHQNMTRPNS